MAKKIPLGRKIDPTTGQYTLEQAQDASGALAQAANPLGAAQQGASPDAAKMAATPVARQSAIKVESAQPASPVAPAAEPQAPQTLQQFDQQAASSPQGDTVKQAEAKQRQHQLSQAFGDAGLTAANLVNAAVAQRSQAVATGAYVQPSSQTLTQNPALATIAPDKQATVLAALTKLAANPNDKQAHADAVRDLTAAGIVGASEPLNFLTKQQAARVGEDLTSELMSANLRRAAGITDDELALLGISPEQADRMTISDFRSRLDDLSVAESQVADIAAQLNTPGIGQQEREMLQRQMRALGASGMISSEANLAQAIERATRGETMEIGGVRYSADELLSDDGFAKLAEQYLNSNPGDTVRRDIERTLPGFGKWAESNRARLAELTGQAEATAGEVAATFAKNEKVVNGLAQAMGSSSEEIHKLLQDTLGFEGGQFSLDAVDLAGSGILSAIANGSLGDINPALILDQLKNARTKNNELFKQIMNMSPEEVKDSGILQSRQAWAEFVRGADVVSRLGEATADSLAKDLFGAKSAVDMMAQLNAVWVTGSYQDKKAVQETRKILDANGDGKLDNLNDVKKRLKNNFGALSTLSKIKELSTGTAVDNKKVASLLQDGRVTADEIKSLKLGDLSAKELSQIRAAASTNAAAKKAIDGKLGEIRKDNTTKLTKGLDPMQGASYFSKLANALKSPENYDSAMLTKLYADGILNSAAGDELPPRGEWPEAVRKAATEKTFANLQIAQSIPDLSKWESSSTVPMRDPKTGKVTNMSKADFIGARDELIHKYRWVLRGQAPGYADMAAIQTALRNFGINPNQVTARGQGDFSSGVRNNAVSSMHDVGRAITGAIGSVIPR